MCWSKPQLWNKMHYRSNLRPFHSTQSSMDECYPESLYLLRPAIFKQSRQSQLFILEHYSAIYCYQADSFTVYMRLCGYARLCQQTSDFFAYPVIIQMGFWQSGLQKKQQHKIRFFQIWFKTNLKSIWNAIPIGFLQMCLSLNTLAVQIWRHTTATSKPVTEMQKVYIQTCLLRCGFFPVWRSSAPRLDRVLILKASSHASVRLRHYKSDPCR